MVLLGVAGSSLNCKACGGVDGVITMELDSSKGDGVTNAFACEMAEIHSERSDSDEQEKTKGMSLLRKMRNTLPLE